MRTGKLGQRFVWMHESEFSMVKNPHEENRLMTSLLHISNKPHFN